MKTTLLSILSFTLLTLALAGCSDKGSSSETGTTQTKKNEVSLLLPTLDGRGLKILAKGGEEVRRKALTLSGVEEVTGKPTLLVFFSTSCPACLAEIPHLVKLQEKFADKFSVLGILVEEKSPESFKPFAEYHEINYPVTIGGNYYALASLVGGVRGIPAMFLYDALGNYATHYVGMVPQAMIENDLKKLLGE